MISERHREKLRVAAQRRLRYPNVPTPARVVGSATLETSVGTHEWTMYVRDDKSSERFWCVKVIASQPVPCKANFNIGVDRTTGRITNSSDCYRMRTWWPTMYAWVQQQARALASAQGAV